MGPYLTIPNKQKNTLTVSNSKFEVVRSAMQGWRKTMEDADICYMNSETQDFALFGVFDGHGGSEVAQFVKLHFLEELNKNENVKTKAFQKALEETFMKMDQLLLTDEGKKEISRLMNPNAVKDAIDAGTEVQSTGEECQAGCTANVVLIHENTLYVANAGDSRCIVGQGGTAREMSVDHKPDNEKEKERILAAGGYVADGRVNSNLNLSRAIGDLEYKKSIELPVDKQLIIAFPEVRVQKIEPDFDFMIIGCDGVWERKTNQGNVTYVTEAIKKGTPLTKIVEELLDELLAFSTSSSTGQGLDNMSMIIVKFIK